MKNVCSTVILCLTALFSASCATYPGTTALRIGMTRDEAIQTMGPPESVSAHGDFEYLNYTLTTANYGYMAGRPYAVRMASGLVESFGYSGQFAHGFAPRPVVSSTRGATPAAENQICVLSVHPTQLVLGATNRVTVKLGYALQKIPEGRISISFNTEVHDRQLSLASRTISTGNGELELTFEVTPADWPGRNDVRMVICLFPNLTDRARSLDHTEWFFPVAR